MSFDPVSCRIIFQKCSDKKTDHVQVCDSIVELINPFEKSERNFFKLVGVNQCIVTEPHSQPPWQ